MIKFTSSQGSCGNPLAKLYDDVNTLGTAVALEDKYVECAGIMNVTCCENDYHSELAFSFNE